MKYFPDTKFTKTCQWTCVLGAALLLSACGGGSDNTTNIPMPAPTPAPVMIDYTVTVSNLTANQPLSPVAVIMHNDSWSSFTAGQSASEEFEVLAESGSPDDLISAASSDMNVNASTNGSSPVAPGSSETFAISIDAEAQENLHLSVLTMLVNTNDAVAAINGADISGLMALDTQSMNAISYDSGTEANSETMATIPGPAAGGEGFNAARDDIRDEIHFHSGVVTAQDGLASSVLDASHKWDNPAMRVVIERVN